MSFRSRLARRRSALPIRPALPLQSSQAPWLPLGVQTALSSAAGASLRLLLTPLDTLKTTRQVQGPRASDLLLARVREGGVPQLFNGALANFAAGWVGSYPWFLTYNTLSAALPPAAGLEGLVRRCGRAGGWGLGPAGDALGQPTQGGGGSLEAAQRALARTGHRAVHSVPLPRSAAIGFAASAVSDTTSNSLRVLKVVRQVRSPRAAALSPAAAGGTRSTRLGLRARWKTSERRRRRGPPLRRRAPRLISRTSARRSA